jgi:hypothetical protein
MMSEYGELLGRLSERYKSGTIDESIARLLESGGGAGCEPVDSGGVPRAAANYPPTTSRGVASRKLPGAVCSDLELEQPFKKLIRGGYDGGVGVGFSGSWHSFYDFFDFKKFADECRANVKDDSDYVLMEYRGYIFHLWLKGSSGGVRYKYVFDYDGVRFYVHNNPVGSIQPVRVHYNAVGLIGLDFFKKHSEVRKLIETLGFDISEEKISRLDFQVMVEYPMSVLSEAVSEDRIICFAREYRFYSSSLKDAFTSFSLGTNFKIRIYDKLLELKSMCLSDPLKFSLMLKFCVGDSFFDENFNLMRVEFSVDRGVLKDFGIDSVSQLLESENGLVRYCTDKWFRVLKDKKDKNRHTNVQPVSDWWRDVQSEFLVWFPGADGHNQVDPLVRVSSRDLENLNCSPEHLDKQAIGCLATSFCLRYGYKNQGEFFDLFQDWFRKNCASVFSRFYERCQVLSAARIKQGEIEGDDYSYNDTIDPRVLNDINWRIRNSEQLGRFEAFVKKNSD